MRRAAAAVVVMLWGHLSRCSDMTTRWHPRVNRCRYWLRWPQQVFSCILNTEFTYSLLISQRHLLPEALQCCDCCRTEILLGCNFPASRYRDPHRDTSEIAVSSSGAWAEGSVQEGFRTAGLEFVSANDFYKRSPFQEAVIFNGTSIFICLPSNDSEVL